MVNFGLAAEIVSLVWGTPANFNGFRVLAALLHGTLVVASGRQPNYGVQQRAPPILGREAIRIITQDNSRELKQLLYTSVRTGLRFCPLEYIRVVSRQLDLSLIHI